MADGDSVPAVIGTMLGIDGVLASRAAEQAGQKVAEAGQRIRNAVENNGAIGDGTDPDYVRVPDAFGSKTHPQLYNAVNGVGGGLDVAAQHSLRDAWHAGSAALLNQSAFTSMAMQRIFADGRWDGASGGAAEAAVLRLVRTAQEAGRVFGAVADRLDAAGWAAEAVRRLIPPPPVAATLDPDNPMQSILPGLVNGDYATQVDKEKADALREARQVLDTNYTGVFVPQSSAVPAFGQVAQFGGSGDPGASASAPGSSSAPASALSGTPLNTDAGAPQDSQIPSDGATSESPSDLPSDGLSQASDLLSGLTGDQTDPASTTPAGTGPTAPAGLGAATPGTPGSGLTGPGSGASVGGLGSGGSGPGGLGAVAPPGVPSGTSASSAAGAAAAGTPRSGPMGGMPGAGRRGSQDDSTDRNAPDYLRRVDEQWTAGLGPVVAVVGADAVIDLEDGSRPPTRTEAPIPAPQQVSPHSVAAPATSAPPVRDAAPVPASTPPPTAPTTEAPTTTTAQNTLASPPTSSAGTANAEPEPSRPVRVGEDGPISATQLAEMLARIPRPDAVSTEPPTPGTSPRPDNETTR